MNASIRTSVKPAAFVLSLFLLQACQASLAPGQTQMTEPQPGRFTQISMNDFMSVTSPPRGLSATESELATAASLTAPPRGVTAPPRGVTSPPQGMTAPPMGLSTPLERSHFARFDLNGDSQWNHAELGAYVTEWRALSQTSAGFATRSVSLDLRVEALIDTYDRNHDRLLDYEEARTLHLGLAQTLSAH